MPQLNDNSNQRPLRILQVVDSLDSGGMEQQLVALMNRLDPRQYAFEVCCIRHAGVNSAKLTPAIPVHTLQKAEGFQRETVSRLRGLLRRGFDLIHTHNLGPLIYAALATLGGRTMPIFHGEHSQLTLSEFGFRRILQRRVLYRCITAVHTVSASQREELLSAGLTHPHLIAIRNGVDIQRFLPAADPQQREDMRAKLGLDAPNSIWLGIVARFGPFKRHAELILAFEALAQEFPAVHLLLVGDGGPEKERILDKIRRSPVQSRIQWAGYQSDPVPYYQAMDILAVPSSNEGLSNTTLEAMSCAVPVLANDICGSREALGDDQGGWVMDLSTVEQLIAALRRVLALSTNERQAIGAQGRSHVAAKFSWSAMAEHYAAWYNGCARRAPFPA